jgi:catechol 2,3-dioxygenase-like lactoylglutathione lyase family enzyme
MDLGVREVRLAVFADKPPDMVWMGVAQRHKIDRYGIDASGPKIGEQVAGARAVDLAKSHARVDQGELGAGVDDQGILVDREIVLVEKIGGEDRVDPLARIRETLSLDLQGFAMFDHIGIAVTDLAATERFYRTVLSALGTAPSHADAELVEWDDWAIGPTDREHPVTRGLHVGFRAPSREAVDAFWQAGIEAGYRDDGAPGPRTVYRPDYYGGCLLDPDGNSAEALHTEREDPVPDGRVDHLWIRVRGLAASKRFYSTIAPHAGLRIGADEPNRVQLVGEGFSFSLIHDERPLTEHVHLAFPARDDATVRAFHAAALAAGYEDHGGPGERAVYHPGYYGAFVLDPDGHNVEVVNHNR